MRDRDRVCGVAFVVLSFNKLGTISLTPIFFASCEVKNFGPFYYK